MSLSGSLRTMSVEDLLDWIDRRFACGRLTVEQGALVRTFQFDSGYVTGTSSSEPSEQLGRLLVRRGLIQQSALDGAFDVQADTGVLLGKILLMTDAVDEADLRATLEDKILESLCDTFIWSAGAFTFEPSEQESASEYEISVNLRQAIEESQRRAGRLREIRTIIPSDESVLYVRDRGAAVPGEGRAGLVEAVERGLTVAEIILENGGRRFQVLRDLAALVQDEVLAVDRRAEARPEPVETSIGEVEKAARGRAAGGDRTGALSLARQALARYPDNPELQKLHRELERSLFAELSRDLLTRFCVPRLLKSREELQVLSMSETERYLVGRIDGRWDLLSLMRVAPLREVEVLITFKQLADRGIVSL